MGLRRNRRLWRKSVWLLAMMQRLLRKLAEVENKGRFTDVLGLTLGRAPPVGVVAADEVEVRDFVVPARLVLPSSGELGLGAVVALFDEVSTFGIMERDRTRPRVEARSSPQAT